MRLTGNCLFSKYPKKKNVIRKGTANLPSGAFITGRRLSVRITPLAYSKISITKLNAACVASRFFARKCIFFSERGDRQSTSARNAKSHQLRRLHTEHYSTLVLVESVTISRTSKGNKNWHENREKCR